VRPTYTDGELRMNHQFVLAFETLRKEHRHREMHDVALRQVAKATGLEYETLRVARSLRNALAHGEAVNRQSLERHLEILRATLGPKEATRLTFEENDIGDRPVRAYRVHAWQDPQLEQEVITNGFVSIGGAEIGDLTGIDDRRSSEPGSRNRCPTASHGPSLCSPATGAASSGTRSPAIWSSYPPATAASPSGSSSARITTSTMPNLEPATVGQCPGSLSGSTATPSTRT
jgi:hypothetical protein